MAMIGSFFRSTAVTEAVSLCSRIYQYLCVAVLCGFFALGVAFTFIFPAFQVADEDMHWFTANRNYERMVAAFGVRKQPVCGQAQALSQKFNINALKSNTSVKLTPGELEGAIDTVAPCPPITSLERSSLISYPGVVLARMMVKDENDRPARAVSVFYLARLLQGAVLLVVFLRLLWFLRGSYPRSGVGLLSLLSFCLSPMVVNQSFGISYDMIIIAATLYGAGLLMFHHMAKLEDVVLLIMLLWGASSGKPVYLPLAISILAGLACLFYRNSGTRLYERARLALTLVGIPALAFLCLFISSSELRGAADAVSWRPSIDPSYNLAFLWADPLRAWRILWNSAWAHMHLPAMTSPLGWTNVNINPDSQRYWIRLLGGSVALDVVFGILLLLVRFSADDRTKVVKTWLFNLVISGLLLAGTATYMLLCSLAMYLMWTPKDTLGVHGLQNRYFLPVYIAAIAAGSLFCGVSSGDGDRRTPTKIDRYGFVAPLVAAIFLTAVLAPHVVSLSVDVLKRFY